MILNLINYPDKISYWIFLLCEADMLNKTTDISNNTIPIIIVAIDTKVNGIEKYLISLNVINTKMPKITPIVINPIPGNPRYRSG